MTTPVRVGTRGSPLALWQAGEVSRKLVEQGYRPEIVTIKTSGDKRQDVSLASVGGKGLFIKELEEALARGKIDIAVHSLKDVPSIIPAQFTLAGFLERGDPRDAWVNVDRMPISEMPAGSRIGTSSPRRRAQLIERFPHLTVEPIRGNVETRINKARAGLYAGIVLAAAGLKRLGLEGEITSQFTVDEMVPAAGQGIVSIETLADNQKMRAAAQSMTHPPSEQAALCERGVLQRFGEQLDCYSAVAVHAVEDRQSCLSGESGQAGLPVPHITIRAFFADTEATRSILTVHRGSDPQSIVGAVYEELVARGAMELLCARR